MASQNRDNNQKPKTMTDLGRDRSEMDREILFSRSVKAGKRLYYVDIKRNRRGDLLMSLTESKKIRDDQHPDALPTYEKHKVFIYQEDFEKIGQAVQEAMAFASSMTAATEAPVGIYDDVPSPSSDDDLKIEF